MKQKKKKLAENICLLGLDYNKVYNLHINFWEDLKKFKKKSPECCLIYLVQFIFTHINKSKKLDKFLMDIPTLSSYLNKIARLSEQIHLFKKQADISNLMIKRAAEVIKYDTSQLKKKFTDDLELNGINSKLKELLLGNGVSEESFFDVVEDICESNECFSKQDIKECYNELTKIKTECMTVLKTKITIGDNLEGNDLLKSCLDVLKINDCGDIKYKDLFNNWNELVENLKDFLVSISNKGRIFSVEDSVSKKMLVLIQILFPFIYDEKNNTLSIRLPKQYSSIEGVIRKCDDGDGGAGAGAGAGAGDDGGDDGGGGGGGDGEGEGDDGGLCIPICYFHDKIINNANENIFNSKLPFNNVAIDEKEQSNIQTFSNNQIINKYVIVHNYILLFSYCNLIYRLCPISLLEKAILKQFTIFDEEEMNKVDKSRTIDILEIIRNTLKTWYETDIGDDIQKQNPQLTPNELFLLFHNKNIDTPLEYKYPNEDLSSKQEHITLMQQYCNKYLLSLKKAFDLIDFLRNGIKKLKELELKVANNKLLELYFNKEDIDLISKSIAIDKKILLELLKKQKKVILDFISNILPMSKSTDTEDKIKYKIEIDFVNAIYRFKELNERDINGFDSINNLKSEYIELEKKKKNLIEKLEKLKEQRALLKKDKKDIGAVVANIKQTDDELKKSKEDLKEKKFEYDVKNSDFEYNVLLSFLEYENFLEDENYSEFMKYVKRIFEISEYEDNGIFKESLKGEKKEIFKTKYQKFKVRLGLYNKLLDNEELKITDKDVDIEKHVKRILGNAMDFRLMSLLEKQKLKRDFCDKDANSGSNVSLDNFDLEKEQQETVQKLIKILSNQLLTFKGLRTANEYKDKLNKNIDDKKDTATLKKNEDKYPILKYVVLLNKNTNKYYINQGLVDYLSVKEEELKTLLRILELYEKCKMLENKLTKEDGGDESDKEDQSEDEGEDD